MDDAGDLRKRYGSLYRYFYGSPDEKDFKRGVAALRDLAALAYAPAIHALAMCYYDGKGVRRSYRQAFDLLHQAAEQGEPDAQLMLGTFYESGRFPDVCPQDHAAAAHWYRLAADKGNAAALYNLGRLYAEGWGVARDPMQAYVCHSLAVAFTPVPHLRRPSENLRDALEPRLNAAELERAGAIIAERVAEGAAENATHLFFWRASARLAWP